MWLTLITATALAGGCDPTWLTTGVWTADEPVDARGVRWADPGFDDAAWTVVALPDHAPGVSNHEVYYRAVVDGPRDHMWLDLVANDGVWLYVNGEPIGHWGGEWRQGGCVNVGPRCTIDEALEPIDLGPMLRDGPNVVGIMLSNGPPAYDLDARLSCRRSPKRVRR